MDERQKSSFGIGVVVGIVMFMAYYWGVFGPSMDLVGSMGSGVGFGFSASVVSYMAENVLAFDSDMSRDKED